MDKRISSEPTKYLTKQQVVSCIEGTKIKKLRTIEEERRGVERAPGMTEKRRGEDGEIQAIAGSPKSGAATSS